MVVSDDFDIYLASASPRRRELLEQIGVRYRLLKSDIPELPVAGESAEDFVIRMAIEKAQAGWDCLDSDNYKLMKPVLGADTAVVIDNEILGKPRDRTHGLAMLERLSGCTHEVLSAVALMGELMNTRLNVSKVTFRTTSAAERERYWQTGEPKDKAGAYGIQGKAAIFINSLEGSYSAVMGLPLYETAELLEQAGIKPLR